MTERPDTLEQPLDQGPPESAVLVVVNDAALRDELCGVVTQQGIATLTADSARSTLAALDRSAPAALVVDADIGVGGGFEIARSIRQHPRGVSLPVVLLTDAHWSRTQKQAAVQQMVKMLLELPRVPRPDDAADALAVAITASTMK